MFTKEKNGKFGNDRTSRGYCGYHITWDGKSVYCRSRLEFIMACHLDEQKIPYKMEKIKYNIDNYTYKPDFLIFNKGKIVKITEIKYSKKEADEYRDRYSKFFELLGIEYEVLYKRDMDRIVNNNPFIGKKVDEWIKNSATIQHDMSGDKNPHYGMNHTKESKKLIGEKTKERNMSIEYKKWFSERVKEAMKNEEVRIKCGKRGKYGKIDFNE